MFYFDERRYELDMRVLGFSVDNGFHLAFKDELDEYVFYRKERLKEEEKQKIEVKKLIKKLCGV